MIGKSVSWFFRNARDAIARRLVKIGVTPNMLTVFGTLLTIATGVCMGFGVKTGNNGYFVVSGALLYCCFACDMLDGAVARIGKLSTTFGAFLDSTLDRVSDFALYAGLGFGFIWIEPANLTFAVLCMVGFLEAVMISYIKARAEDFIDDCSVGFWQRGERCAAVIISAFACNPGALAVMLGIGPAFTVLRRFAYAKTVIAGGAGVADPRINGKWYHKIQPWLYPRTSLPYDAAVLGCIAFLIFARIDPANWDVLSWWLNH